MWTPGTKLKLSGWMASTLLAASPSLIVNSDMGGLFLGSLLNPDCQCIFLC